MNPLPPILPLLLIFLLAGTARADPCDELPKPSVTLKRLDERPTLNTRYSYRELTHLGSTIARRGNQVLGLTSGKAIAQFATSTPLYVDRSGQWECASPQLTLTLGFKPMALYVAKEFPEGSCAYKEIYEHELRHVKAYQDHLTSIEKDITDTLNRRFATGSPWRGPAGQTRAVLRRELDEKWLPYIQREIRRGDEAQARIDTDEEYTRIADACNGEVRKRTR